jgi:hypothetical protein
MSVSHQTVTLARGKHRSPRSGACVMELASMLAGEPFTDRPAGVCPIVGAFLRAYNDAVDDDRRQDLYAYAAAAVGTRAPWPVTRRRAERCRAELRSVRHGPLGALTVPRALPASLPALERLAARVARELHRAGAGGHARALRLADELVAPGAGPVTRPASRLSRSDRARAGAAAR